MADNRQLSNAEIISNDTFERLRIRNSRRRIWRILAYVLTALLFIILFAVVCVTLFFKVTYIEITGSQIYEGKNDSIIELTGIEFGQNLYSFKSAVLEQEIITEYPYIKDVKFKRHLPDRIEIHVTEDIPFYYIEIGGEYFILSEELRVLEKVDNTDRIERINLSFQLMHLELPTVIYAVVGQPIIFRRESNFQYTKEMLDFIQISEVIYGVKKLNIVNKFNNYFIYNNYKVVIGNSENISSKLILAMEIIKRNNGDPAIIDVTDITKGSIRQDGQVVIE